MKVNLGTQMSGSVNLGYLDETDEEFFLGFDALTDDEIIDVMQAHPQPEIMGGRLRKWFKRRKKRAKKFVQKLKKRFKKMPKWAKVLTGVALAPVAIATGAAIAPAALATAAPLAPLASKVGIGLAARKIAKRRAARRAAQKRKVHVAQVRAKAQATEQAKIQGRMDARRRLAMMNMRRRQRGMYRGRIPAGTQAAAAPVQEYAESPAIAQQPAQAQPAAAPEEKKGGLGIPLALGALALPFIL